MTQEKIKKSKPIFEPFVSTLLYCDLVSFSNCTSVHKKSLMQTNVIIILYQKFPLTKSFNFDTINLVSKMFVFIGRDIVV